MVLVRMRQEHGTNAPLTQIREVRQDEIDAEMLVPGERQAGVHDHELLAQLVHRHVLADLAEAAQRDDPQYRHGLKYHLRGRQKGEHDSPVRGREPPRLIFIL